MAYRRRQHQQHTGSSTSSGSSTTPSSRPQSSVSSSSSSASYSSSYNHPGLGLGLGEHQHQHQDDDEFRQRTEAYDAAAETNKAEAGFVDVNFDFDNDGTGTDTNNAVAAKAIRASSAARRDSSLSSAYAFHHHPPPAPPPSSSAITSTTPPSSSSSSSSSSSKVSKKPYNNNNYEYTSIKGLKESKQGFWTSLARKAKSFLDDNDDYDHPQQQQQQQLDSPRSATTIHTHIPPPHSASSATKPKYQNSYPLPPPHDEPHQKKKTDSPAPLKKGLNAISSSLNYIGNAVEEGLSVVENRTADIIQETRKHIKKKSGGVAAANNQATNRTSTWQQRSELEPHMQPQIQTDLELQLKASRDVAMAMAAKAKLLLRELKTVKADLAFAKERCAQLEEENKVLRENRERGGSPEDDDLIRLQLETLLAEKARLAHENSVYARENRFLREVVEYHQLTMQDVIYLDEGTEEVTEVYPVKAVSNPHSVFTAPLPPALSTGASPNMNLRATQDMPPHPVPPPGVVEVSQAVSGLSFFTSTSNAVDKKKQSNNSL